MRWILQAWATISLGSISFGRCALVAVGAAGLVCLACGREAQTGARTGEEPHAVEAVSAVSVHSELDEVPDWVPSYPNVEPVVLHCNRQDASLNGSLSYEILAGRDAVASFFEHELELGGFNVASKASFGAVWPTTLVKGTHPSGCCFVKLKIEGDERVASVILNYSQE